MIRAAAAAALVAAAAGARADAVAPDLDLGAPLREVAPGAPDAGARGGDSTPLWSSAALFAAGATTAFLAHESGHVVANFALGNVPRLQPVSFAGTIPFFAISPDISCSGSRCVERDGRSFGAGPRGLFLILSAGFDVQHVTDEIILSADPHIREQQAPFRKGMLAFNTLTSIGYVLADWIGVEPAEGDVRAMWRDAGASRGAVNGLLLAAAGLDIARYFLPDVGWLPWASRAVKLAFGGLAFTF